MSRALPRSARPLALAVALALGLTGCGAGFRAQTYQERATADATNVGVGAIAVRNARVVAPPDEQYAAGDDAEVFFALVNDGGEDDRLVEITTEAARGVQLVEREGSVPVTDIEVPALGTTGELYGAVLQGLAEDLRPGEFVELTLRFERNGEVTIPVPVATPEEYDYERERSGNFHVPGEEEAEEEGGGGLSEAGEEESAVQGGGESSTGG